MGAIEAIDFDDPHQRQQATVVLTQLVSSVKRLLFTGGAENSSNPQLRALLRSVHDSLEKTNTHK